MRLLILMVLIGSFTTAQNLRRIGFNNISLDYKKETSVIEQEGYFIIENAQQLNKLGKVSKTHNVNRNGRNEREAQEDINFKKEVILVVTLGEKGSGGHHVNISDVFVEKGNVIIEVEKVVPGPNDLSTMALTHPIHTVRISRKVFRKRGIFFKLKTFVGYYPGKLEKTIWIKPSYFD